MFIVAEIGASHARKLHNVLSLINQTHEADAFKIQTWSKDSMAVEHRLKSGPWVGRDLRSLYRMAQLPWEMHNEIFAYCKQRGLTVFSAPFDIPSVEFLERLDCPIYKIASYELVDLELVRRVAETGKPMILSTGQVDHDELCEIIDVAAPINDQITLLHCVSQYPTDYSQANLDRMASLRDFQFPVGLSDHSRGSQVAVVAAALGAQVIEKHIKRYDSTLDGSFAMRPSAFNTMAKRVREVAVIRGSINAEPEDLELRRSLYYAHNLKAGEMVTKPHLKTARPNKGLCPLDIEKVLGRKLTEDVERDQPVGLDQFR